jgi:hypothetical protein
LVQFAKLRFMIVWAVGDCKVSIFFGISI